MKLDDLVDQATEQLKGRPVPAIPQPCIEKEIAEAESNFTAAFGKPFPEAYKRILRRANGISYNGLVIWPAKPESLFQETIYKANATLREDFSEDYIYYGNMDEELYVFDLRTQEYCALEYVGKPIWKHFSSAEEMFTFMLERAAD